MNVLKAPKKPLPGSSESSQRIYDFLKNNRIGVLASVDPNGNPHAATIYFSVDEEFNILFTTKERTKKHDNLVHNNHAMLVTYEPTSQTTAQVTGVTEIVDNKVQAKQIFIDTLKASRDTSESGNPPISKLQAGGYVAYKLKPVQIRMAIFRRPDPSGADIYETLDFKT